jgi:GT2 family glycosyltransferase
MNTGTPLVSIIIVTYNSQEEIIGCLDSIFKSNIPSVVYIVDNASADNTVSMVQDYAKKEPNVKLIINTENKGLAYANNQPLPFIDTKYTLILNPDLLLREDTISKLLNLLESEPKIGMAGPLTLFEGGEKHLTAFVNYNIFTIIMWRIFPYRLMRHYFDNYTSYRKKEVLFVSGACYLIPTALYKELGGYDKELFLTISDVADIGVRIRQKGYKAMFYPDAVITHFCGRSNAPLKYLTQYWGLTGDLYFIRKHKGRLQELFVKSVFVTSSFLRGLWFKTLAMVSSSDSHKGKTKLYLDLTKALWKYEPPIKAR